MVMVKEATTDVAVMLDMAANYIIQALKSNGVIIQRYNSYSTNSIYLKFDFGVANSIRISDHRGKKGLSYRYNLLSNCPYPVKSKDNEGYIRYYFPLKDVQQLINLILTERYTKIEQYGMKKYRKFMEINQVENQTKEGFWKKAVLV